LRYHSFVLSEHSIITAFVKRGKRDRYTEILSDPRLRHKFINQLAHFADFDPKYRLPIPSGKLFVENIAAELRKRHSPSTVDAILEDPRLDPSLPDQENGRHSRTEWHLGEKDQD
jgi:hypothetical protein